MERPTMNTTNSLTIFDSASNTTLSFSSEIVTLGSRTQPPRLSVSKASVAICSSAFFSAVIRKPK